MAGFKTWLDREFTDKKILLEEATLLPDTGIEFWHATVLTNDEFAISGGFHADRIQARKIALVEYFERKMVRELAKDPNDHGEWGFDLIPTACGFAAGFNKRNTVYRALAEAAERWVMSKWIDEGFFIEEVAEDAIEFDKVSCFLKAPFREVRYFKKNIRIFFQGEIVEINVAQTMGITETGIFPGSSAQINNNCIWQHALLESFRHFQGVQNNTSGLDQFPHNKVRFFAENKELALAQIEKANKKEWPNPQITLERVKSFYNEEVFLARIIFDGWRSWHEGSIERFLY